MPDVECLGAEAEDRWGQLCRLVASHNTLTEMTAMNCRWGGDNIFFGGEKELFLFLKGKYLDKSLNDVGTAGELLQMHVLPKQIGHRMRQRSSILETFYKRSLKDREGGKTWGWR